MIRQKPLRGGNCPRTEQLLYAAEAAMMEYKNKKDGGAKGIFNGLQQDEVTHVLKSEGLLHQSTGGSQQKFNFHCLFVEGGQQLLPEPPPGSWNIDDTISNSRKLLVDVAQTHHHKDTRPDERKKASLPEVRRPDTPEAVRRMGCSGSDETVPKKKKKRIQDSQLPQGHHYGRYKERKSSKGVTKRLKQYVTISERRVQRCKFGPVRYDEDNRSLQPFEVPKMLSPRDGLDSLLLEQYSPGAIKNRVEKQNLEKSSTSLQQCAKSVFITAPTELSLPQSEISPSKPQSKSRSIIPMLDLQELHLNDLNNNGGQYALTYRKIPLVRPPKRDQQQSYCSFKRDLDERTNTLNNKYMDELSRCNDRRRLFFPMKYEALSEISNFNKHESKFAAWNPASTELHRCIENVALARDARERTMRQQTFFEAVSNLLISQQHVIPDCKTLREKLTQLVQLDETTTLDVRMFQQLLSSFETSRFLQDGLCSVLNQIRPIFGISCDRWNQILSSRYRSFEGSNIELLLDNQLAKQYTPPRTTPAKVRLKVSTLKGAERTSPIGFMTVIQCELGWLKQKNPNVNISLMKNDDNPPTQVDLRESKCEFKTSSKAGPRPLWNEDFILLLLDEKVVIEFSIYDVVALRGGPILYGIYYLDGLKLQKGARHRVAVPLRLSKSLPQPAIDPPPPPDEELIIFVEPVNFGFEPQQRKRQAGALDY